MNQTRGTRGRRTAMGLAVMMTVAGTVMAPEHAGAQSAGTALYMGVGGQRHGMVSTERSPEAAPLDRIVNIDMHNAPLEDVLDAIARQADINLVYSEHVMPIKRRVTLKGDHLSVRDALRRILVGVPVSFEVTGERNVTFKAADKKQAQEGGKISGRVVDSTSKQGLSGVTVSIQGTRHITVTSNSGGFSMTGIPAGKYTLLVRVLGYAAKTIQVTVGTEPVTITVPLRATPTTLTEVVTTGSGDQERMKVGNSITTVNADSVVATAPIYSITDLLETRVPGMTTTRTSGAVGSATRLNLRGYRTANASNDPIVILDGVRITSENVTAERDANLAGKNNRPGRLDDIDPSIIESIDVLKGASASSLYGSDAANGVIVIKTKRGKAGPPRWNFSGDHNVTKYSDHNLPLAVKAFGHDRQGYSGLCILSYYAVGYCPILDSVVTADPLGNPRLTPFATGYDNKVSTNVSGGSETLRYFLSGSWLDQLGASRIPAQNVAIFERVHGPGSASKSFIRPNAQTNGNFTGTVTAQAGQTGDLALTSSLISRYQRRGVDGMASAAYNPIISDGDTTSPVNTWRGSVNQRSDRLKRSFTSVSGNWRPLTWLSMSGNFGYDLASNNDRDFVPRNGCQPFCGQNYGGQQDSLGFVWFGRREIITKSGGIQGAVQYPMPSSFSMMTSAGIRATRNSWDDIQGYMSNLAAGRSMPYAGAGGTINLTEDADQSATAGWFLSQKLGWRERLFLTAAFQQDKGSALGADVKPIYPKWDLSYLVSEEQFFDPLRKWFDSFRLRAAFGHAGIQPGSAQRLRSFSQLVRYVTPNGVLENYASLGGLGNNELRPERSVEIEYGTDITMWDSRVQFEVTRFRSTTVDAILPRSLAPSVGAVSSNGVTPTRNENVGTTRNTGTEASLGVNILRSRMIDWFSMVTYSAHHSIIVKLGPGVQPFSGSGNTDAFAALRGVDDSRLAEGYPLFARWARPVVGYYDANGNGIIDRDEVRFGDTLVFISATEPKYQLSINNNFQFLNSRLSVATTMSYENGLSQINTYGGSLASLTAPGNIQGTLSPAAEAYLVANQLGKTPYGYIESVNTLRFNTLSVTVLLPQRVTKALRASQTSLSLIGSNIGMWSSYSGADPSVNTTGAAGNRLADDGALPQPRTWGLRARINF